MATQPQCISNSTLNFSYQFPCCQEETKLKRTTIYSWYRNYSHCTKRLTDVKIITSKETSLVYCLNLVGLPNDDVSMSNYTNSVDVRMTGECWIGKDINGNRHSLRCAPSTCLEGWRKITKSLSLFICFRCDSSQVPPEYPSRMLPLCHPTQLLFAVMK